MQNKKDFTLTLITTQAASKVFAAIQNVRTWWSGYYSEEFSGNSENLNDEFVFRAGPGVHYSKHKLVELKPDEKMVWLTTDSELSFLENKEEWTGSKIVFEISKNGINTELKFTHEGLNPDVECYEACAPAWTQYLQNKLLPLIESNN